MCQDSHLTCADSGRGFFLFDRDRVCRALCCCEALAFPETGAFEETHGRGGVGVGVVLAREDVLPVLLPAGVGAVGGAEGAAAADALREAGLRGGDGGGVADVALEAEGGLGDEGARLALLRAVERGVGRGAEAGVGLAEDGARVGGAVRGLVLEAREGEPDLDVLRLLEEAPVERARARDLAARDLELDVELPELLGRVEHGLRDRELEDRARALRLAQRVLHLRVLHVRAAVRRVARDVARVQRPAALNLAELELEPNVRTVNLGSAVMLLSLTFNFIFFTCATGTGRSAVFGI